MKGYINNITTEKDHNGFGTWIHVDFSSKIEGAGFWATQQEAENEAVMLEHHDIAIRTAEGQRHVCKGYKVQERAPREFVIWVDAPFISPNGTDKTGSAPAA